LQEIQKEAKAKKAAKKAVKNESVAAETAERQKVLAGIGFQVDEMLGKFSLTGPEYFMVRVCCL
jgi:hypothetical protein